jgi:hypothetical protein
MLSHFMLLQFGGSSKTTGKRLMAATRVVRKNDTGGEERLVCG